MRYYIRRNSHKIAKGFAVLVVLGVFLFGGKYYIDSRGEIVDTTENTSADSVSQEDVVSLSTRVLSFGPMSWAGRVDAAASSEVSKTSYPFAGLDAFVRSDYDTWITSLNCHIASSNTTSCKDTYIAEFATWFNVVGLGGLSQDSSESDQTGTKLASKNIQFFGPLMSSPKSKDCDVVSLPARLELENGNYKSSKLPIVLCGVNGETTLSEDITSKIQVLSGSLPVWVYAYDSGVAPKEMREQQYRAYIDAGADMVIGSAGTELSSTESYKGKLIAYSLGTFLGYSTGDTQTGHAALLAVDVTAIKSDSVIGWEEIGKTCTGYDDLCIEAGISRKLEKPVYTYTYSVIAVDTTNPSQPILADDHAQVEVINTLKWVITSEKLQ